MNTEQIGNLTLAELQPDLPLALPEGGYVSLVLVTDRFGSQMNKLTISNGRLLFTVILERGMDIGEIWLEAEKISWERDERYLLHPDHVDLTDNEHSGWDSGFYAAVAAIGPEIFGTPDEVRTVHGTGSYSPALPESVRLSWDEQQICLEGDIPVRGYGISPVYHKTVRIITRYGAADLFREDTVQNVTDSVQPVDDGYHIQLAGAFMAGGGVISCRFCLRKCCSATLPRRKRTRWLSTMPGPGWTRSAVINTSLSPWRDWPGCRRSDVILLLQGEAGA